MMQSKSENVRPQAASKPSSSDLERRYAPIGIAAVAAAVRYVGEREQPPAEGAVQKPERYDAAA